MSLEASGLNILIIVQIVVDIALICAILVIYKRLQFLDPHRLERLIALLRENELLVKKMAAGMEMESPKVPVEDQVLALVKAGKSTADIAARLDLTQAEVELILERVKARSSN